MKTLRPVFLLTVLWLVVPARAAIGEARSVVFAPQAGCLPLVENKNALPLVVDDSDWPGVRRVVHDFQADIEWVSGTKPRIETALPEAPAIVVIGTLGRSALIDRLVGEGKLDAEAIRGAWESWFTQVVEHPFPGVERALIIVGSDKRGTIYGVYDLSEQIGVSPWYWWADVPAQPHPEIFVKPERVTHGSPAVKYRGVFINDEAPALSNWIYAKYGTAPVRTNPPVPPNVANYGREFYARIFEALLRLRANYLWPAMWNNAFNEDDPANALLADEYGIVMGTSHQEPMIRSQMEWDRRFKQTIGTWNYAKYPDVMEAFWREGVRRNKAFESIVTMGLRGANDTEMAPGGPAANRKLLEKIVREQRRILEEEMNPDVTRIPQLWCLYKEVKDYYDDGMRVPGDITLLWTDDNWGNIRRLPTAAERKRPGGAGMYYHFDYVGGPRSYKWMDTNPLPKVWEQMSLAAQYGADRVWIVNVGDFKGMERPTEFFMNLAWNPARWTGENLDEFTRLWAEREFGPEHAGEIAAIVSRTAKYNGRRKPEMLAPDTYSLVHYREAETVVADFLANARRADEIHKALPAACRDAFYQLVLFPAKACAVVNALYKAAGENALHARQGRASAGEKAARVRALFQTDLDLMKHYNTVFAGGRWAHFMDQTHLGYTSWKDPDTNSLDHIKLFDPVVPEPASLGVAVEGSEAAWPGGAGEAALPRFDVFNRQSRFVEVFNRGKTPFDYTLSASEPWIVLGEAGGTAGKDKRVSVGIDWEKAPKGWGAGFLTVKGAGAEVRVNVSAHNPEEITPATLRGFVEAEGVVSIEPEHFARNVEAGQSRWARIKDYGRTLSGMRAEAPVDADAASPGKNAPCLEYGMYLFTTGKAEVAVTTSPTLNFLPERALRYAVSFDEEKPRVVTLMPEDFRSDGGNKTWEQYVGNNAIRSLSKHTLTKPGYHTLKIWMIDPGVVIQKLEVNLGGLKPSYLGPPESFRAN